MVGHVGQAGEHVLEIIVGVNASASATFDESVKDGSAFTGVGIAHEKPVLFAQGRRTNGVLDQIVVDLHAASFQINIQRPPLTQRIINGDAH